VALQNLMTTGRMRAQWLGCLCVFCLPSCAGSDANSGSTSLAAGGSAGIGGSAPAVGGTSSTTGGGTVSANGGGLGFGGATADGGTAASTGGTVGQGGGLAGAAPIGGAGGGRTQSGGANSGGTPFGGSSAGGNNTGGKATGGTATSGSKTTGGASTGGAETGGGKATGGASAGGATTGGSKATGGASTGGAATGGSKATGGASTGGTATGGSSSSDLCPTGIAQTITVAKDGSGQYSTVQAAVDSIASGSSTHIRINVKAGTYTEKITIASRTNLCLVGDSATTTILTYNDSNSSVGSTSGSASVYVSANDFSATQLTFQNSYGAGSQAVALRTTGQRQQFLDCRLVGYQDTLYVHSGTQYFRNCYVQGNTDYVFGGATAILQNCEVRNVQSGSAASAPNTASSTAYGLVFLGCSFTAASGVSNVALARPWGADGAAAFLNSTLGSHISSAGFTSMSGNDPANARFSEYQSTGSGANATGRSSYQMTAAQAANYTIANVYGGGWTPSYSQ
jgi:pectinesterase